MNLKIRFIYVYALKQKLPISYDIKDGAIIIKIISGGYHDMFFKVGQYDNAR